MDSHDHRLVCAGGIFYGKSPFRKVDKPCEPAGRMNDYQILTGISSLFLSKLKMITDLSGGWPVR